MLDSPPPTADVGKLMAVEARFQLTDQQDHTHYEVLIDQARRSGVLSAPSSVYVSW